MNLRRRLGIALTTALLAGALTRTAHADERSDARRHFRAGLTLIGQGRFDQGIAELEAAYAILPHPNVLYNIARAYYEHGNLDRAQEYLRRYLQNDVPDRAEVEAVVTRLESRLRAQQGGNTTVAAGPTTTNTPSTTNNTTQQSPTEQVASLRGTAEELRRLAEQEAARGVPNAAQNATALRERADALARIADQLSQANTSGSGTNTPANGTQNPAGGNNTVATPTPPPTPAAAGLTSGGRGDEDLYEERVVTASRAAQSPLDAPNATGIITAQDIRLSGLTTVAELLRRLAGIDVMQLETGDFQVSARGFNQRMANKMLVLIDGRSVYLDFLGLTTWTSLFPAVEEIERIEVVRGPGSALYGADAFAGVVNIVTRPPGDTRTQLGAAAGNGSQGRGYFLNAGRAGNFSYRATAQYEQRGAYDQVVAPTDRTWVQRGNNTGLSTTSPRFNIDAQYRINRNILLRGGIGARIGGNADFTPSGLLRRYFVNLTYFQPFLQFEASNLGPWSIQARTFWNHVNAEAGPVILQDGARNTDSTVRQNVVDLDVQVSHRANFGRFENLLQFGGGYRLKSISWGYLNADHTLNFFSLFVQDTLRFSNRFSAVASLRGDYHPVIEGSGIVLSPRGSVIFRPTDRRALRLTGGTAFRTPTMLELYFDLYYPTPTPGLTVRGQGAEVFRGGTQRLRPETALSIDLGYRDETFDRVQWEAAVFFNRGADLINLTPVVLDPLGSSTSTNREVNVGTRYYANDPAATYVYGVEASLRVNPIDGLDIYGNYTLSLTTHDATALLAEAPGRSADRRTPMHKFNIGVQGRTRIGLDFEVYGHFVSDQVWLEPVFDPRQGSRDVAFELPSYFVLNARVGWRLFRDRLDLGIVGTNLTDFITGGHLEHPLGARINTRVMGTASFRF